MIDKLLTKGYKFKATTDVGLRVISYISGKLPELMSGIYLAEKTFGFTIEGSRILWLALFVFFALYVIGKIYYDTGLLKREQLADVALSPVQLEIYTAAQKINKSHEDYERYKNDTK